MATGLSLKEFFAETAGSGILPLQLAGLALGIVGLVFFLGAAVGLVRFPDFYTRMHAAGKGDTLSSFLILCGFAAYELQDFTWASALVALKIVGIGIFVMLTSPTSTHVLMEAGYDDRIRPWKKEEKK